jgi:hypothetical protein
MPGAVANSFFAERIKAMACRWTLAVGKNDREGWEDPPKTGPT